MKKSARKILLPQFVLTEICSKADPAATTVTILQPGQAHVNDYYARPRLVAKNGLQVDGELQWFKHQFNFFPVVLGEDGVPWAEANIYLLSLLEDAVDPTMSTYASIAEDLVAYRRYLDETDIDWKEFPSQRLSRPTYRFNGHLKYAVRNGTIAASTAKRRMGTVIRFYRWLKVEGVLIPEHEPWKETDRYIDITDGKGFKRPFKVTTTDISIKIVKQNDPYDEAIEDGGKLRPLPIAEQEWVVDALNSLGNTEMKLIHLMGFFTGARIQSILTFQVRHTKIEIDENCQGELRLPIGPGTGIDSKNDKQMSLLIPIWLYILLNTYALSDRAKKRRARAVGGDCDSQYLFLSVKGAPFYESKKDLQTFDPGKKVHHVKRGQAVRQFMTEKVLPFVREKYGVKKFHYKFHDTRATAGMNWTDHQLKLVEQGEITLFEAREYVRTRMGHESSVTTDRYFQFRKNLKILRWATKGYDEHLRRLAEQAMEGVK